MLLIKSISELHRRINVNGGDTAQKGDRLRCMLAILLGRKGIKKTVSGAAAVHAYMDGTLLHSVPELLSIVSSEG